MMNVPINPCGDTLTDKENAHSSSKISESQFLKPKPRTALGALSENEVLLRSHSQGSQFSWRSSVTDSSQPMCLSHTSSSSFDVYVEEACEVVLEASGQRVVSGNYSDEEANALKNEDAEQLLALSLGSFQNEGMDLDHSEPQPRCDVESVYDQDIYWELRNNEVQLHPQPGYLEKHPEITDGMRSILVDWLVDVVEEFKLCSETLYLAVNYVDRFLSSTASVRKGRLQLVGTTALMVAAKFEEISPPELDDFVYITDSTYTKRQLIRMEHILLQSLDFRMMAATAEQFLRQFLLVHPLDATTENLAMYLSELSLIDMDPFLRFRPSVVAASAYCLASFTLSGSLWPSALQDFTAYTLADFEECLVLLHVFYGKAESLPHQTIRDKYKSSK